MKKQQWTIEEQSIFSNNSHLVVGNTILKGDHPRNIPAKFDSSGFRGEDLNVKVYD
jgi:hypothetical protein